MLSRMIGAALLRSDTFEEVEADSNAMVQALIVVIIVAIAGAIGSFLSEEGDIVRALIFGIVFSIVSWAVWALVAVFVGTKILKTEDTEADWGQVARCTGFAQTPGLLSILVFVPVVGGLFGVVSLAWRVAAMVVAIRQSLDYTSTWRAFFVILISFIPVLIINAVAFVVLSFAL
ncbi:MAG: YIP1 family protein [Chloroflexi bacterium]|nr:YIP1 family protein [Chloroflexota bacterium]